MKEAARPEDVKQVYANSTGGAQGEGLDSTHQSELPPTEWAEAAHRYGETWVQGSVVVYTDGAARCNQFRSLRFAGVGAFWAEGHPFNVSAALPGEEQTNNRAELAAVIQVLQLELRPVEVRSDSAYVVNGIHVHMERWRAAGWHRKGHPIKHADLWKELGGILASRLAQPIEVTKVKGHATSEQVAA